MLFPSFFNAGPATYEIEQSLRFDGSSYLSWTPSSAGNRRTWTWSGWVKRGPVNTTEEDIFGVEYTTGDVPSNSVRFSGSANSDQKPRFSVYLGSGGDFSARSSGVARDPAAWMHFVAVWDTTNATESERMRFYINGEQQSRYYGNSITQNTEGSFNTTSTHRFSGGSTYGRLFKGYLAETHFVDGTALDATDFGEYDNNGVWRPKRYTGSYGTNGFYLKFDPSATNGIGHDHSGNGNNWTASNFTTSGTGTDVMSDTPTTNWCTLNPLVRPGNTAISDGNLTYSTSIAEHALSTFGVTEGKWYCEVTLGGTNCFLGLVNSTHYRLSYIGSTTLFAVADNNSEYSPNSTRSFSSLSSFTTSDVIGFALDATNKTCDVYKNNSKVLTYDTFTLDGPYFFSFDRNAPSPSVTHTVNFGQRAFAYTPPTGFKALNTSNLSAPTVKDGSQHMNTVTWTGTGASRTIDFGMQPDWIWAKGKNTAANHRMSDNVRGSDGTTFYNLCTNNSNAENTDTVINGITSTGITFKNVNDHPNISGSTYVGWGWKAGGAGGSTNTDGSITSTVSANPSAGFSIVSYTGTGSAATVGHGLGVAPSFIIAKNRDSTSNWDVYHTGLTSASYRVQLNSTGAQSISNGSWNGTAPTSTVFSVKDDTATNSSNADHIAYCFAEVEGYSKFGSYTGNGSTDGVFVHCGFSPRWIMWKETTVGESWFIHDTARTPYNVSTQMLRANYALQESTGDSVDILSNGFKFRSGGAGANYSGRVYIFAAFAEHPTGGSGVSPATAR